MKRPIAPIGMYTALAMSASDPAAAQVAAPPVQPTAAASAAAAVTAKAEQELQKGEKDRFEAVVKADVGALDRLLAPELIYTHSNAQVQDKAGFIGDIKAKTIRYLSIEPNDLHVTVLGTTAIVTGTAAVHVIQNGNDLKIRIRYTNVQLNRRGEWQMVAWQATRIPD